MDASWLDKYPKAAAMLQGDDDVLLYEPQSSSGPEEPPLPDVRLLQGVVEIWHPDWAVHLASDAVAALEAAQVLMGAAVDAMQRRIDAAMLADVVEGRPGQLLHALIDLHCHMLQAGHAPDGATLLISQEAYAVLEEWARTRLIARPDSALWLMGFRLLPGTDRELGGQTFALQDAETADRGDW